MLDRGLGSVIAWLTLSRLWVGLNYKYWSSTSQNKATRFRRGYDKTWHRLTVHLLLTACIIFMNWERLEFLPLTRDTLRDPSLDVFFLSSLILLVIIGLHCLLHFYHLDVIIILTVFHPDITCIVDWLLTISLPIECPVIPLAECFPLA